MPAGKYTDWTVALCSDRRGGMTDRAALEARIIVRFAGGDRPDPTPEQAAQMLNVILANDSCEGAPEVAPATTVAVQPLVPQATAPFAYYDNCDEAREAGVAPINRGEPGYRPELDRNDDGVACETD